MQKTGTVNDGSGFLVLQRGFEPRTPCLKGTEICAEEKSVENTRFFKALTCLIPCKTPCLKHRYNTTKDR